jgi:spore germination protein YaaH
MRPTSRPPAAARRPWLAGLLLAATALSSAAPLTSDRAAVFGQAQDDETSAQAPSSHYLQAEEHSADTIDFAPGAPASVPYSPQFEDAEVGAGIADDGTPPDPGDVSSVDQPITLGAARADLASVRQASPSSDPEETTASSSRSARREVFGFLPYWELAADTTVLDWRTLSTVAYFSVGCTSSGALARRNPDGSPTIGWSGWTSSRMTSVIDDAHRNHARVVLTLSCFAWSGDGATAQAGLLSSARARATAARQLAAAVRERGADGVNLDFEPILPGLEDEFVRLVRAVRAELDRQVPDSQLTLDTMGIVGDQPIAAAVAPGGADAVFIMGYDYRTENAAVAGSISPLAGPAYDLEDTIAAYTALIPPSKIILGVPWFGRAFSTPTDRLHADNISGGRNGDVAEPTYDQAVRLASISGRRWDPVEKSPWTAYRKEVCGTSGCVSTWRQAYYDDATSLKLRYDLVNASNLRGVGIWALGYDGAHPELRAALFAKFRRDSTPPVAGITVLPPVVREEGFRVAWRATDESAVVRYDVQAAMDGGGWRPWLTATRLTSSIFGGRNGHVYAFRVRAVDARGNVSTWRSLPASAGMSRPARLGPGGFGSVVADGLRLRALPSTSAAVLLRFRVGDTLEVIGGPVTAEGYTWFQVVGPVHEWGPVAPTSLGWVAAFGNGFLHVEPRVPASTTRVVAAISGLTIGGGTAHLLTPNGDGIQDRLRLSWTNERRFDDLSLRIYQADGTFVGAVALGARAAGPASFTWDGRVAGALLPAGTYVLQLHGVERGRAWSAPSASPVGAWQLARSAVVIGRG